MSPAGAGKPESFRGRIDLSAIWAAVFGSVKMLLAEVDAGMFGSAGAEVSGWLCVASTFSRISLELALDAFAPCFSFFKTSGPSTVFDLYSAFASTDSTFSCNGSFCDADGSYPGLGIVCVVTRLGARSDG